MNSVILVLSMYFTPYQMQHDTPFVTIMEFDTYAECEFYIEQHTPEINLALSDDLLGYSTLCKFGE